MRTIIALTFTALTVASASAGYYRNGEFREPCKNMPPESARQPPSVEFTVVALPSAEIQIKCGGPYVRVVTACAKIADPLSGAWVVYIDNDLTPEDHACVMVYETAHMPPNSWVDWAWESHIKFLH